MPITWKSMKKTNQNSISGYFLAGRHMTWLPVGASLFASNIGSEHFIGLAGSGAASGLAVGSFEINALIILQLSGWVFLPVFIASRVCTLPEYMDKRFGGHRIRSYLAILSLSLYIFTKISVNLYSGGLFIEQALNWNIFLAIFVILIVTGLCTFVGGLTAVIFTDTFQFVLILAGAGFVAVKAFQEVGGYGVLQEKYMNAIPSIRVNNSDCGIPSKSSWSMLRPVDDPYMPWLGFIFGQTPASIWYWCTDQIMVQRLLSAKSLSHAQGGTLFAGFMKIFPLFFIVMPGMISRVLYADEVACVDPEECIKYCGNPSGCSNIAYPRLVLSLMPTGFRGLMMSVMLAALVSDLTSIFNSSSTIFSLDLWTRIRKNASSWEILIVGRTSIFAMVALSLLWIPVIQNLQGGQMFIYIQSVSAYLAPPIAAVFILAVLWPRMNEQGAFWSLMLGLCVGIVRMSLDFWYVEPLCGEVDTRHPVVKNFHYMYFACLLFWITAIAGISISLKTKNPEDFRLIRTTFWTRKDTRDRDDDLNAIEMKTVGNEERISEEHDEPRATYSETGGPQETVTEEHSPFRDRFKKCVFFLCGVKPEVDEQKEKELSEHLINSASLHQSKFQKIILNTFLSLVLAMAVSLFIYFAL